MAYFWIKAIDIALFARKNLAILCLIILIIFYCITNFIWLYRDTLPPAWDQSGHMQLSLKYYTAMNSMKSANDIAAFLSISHYYPPFFHVSAAPIIFLLGFSEDKVILINFFYLILLVVSLFKFGKILFNERVGVFAVLLTLFYPIIYAMSREYLIDFALVSMVTTTQYFILKSNGGVKGPWNFLLGIIAGFTLLTKPVSIIFFAPLWIFIGWGKIRNRKDFLSLLMSIAICLAIAIPWHLLAFSDMLKLNSYWQNFATIVDKEPRSFFLSIAWYGNALKNPAISQNLLFFLIAGVISFLIFDRKIKTFIVLMTCMIPAYFFLALMPNKDPRYIMPVLPACALLTVGGIDALKKKNIRNIMYSLMILIGFMQFNNLSFATPPFLVKQNSFFYNHAPIKQDWMIKKILKHIENHVEKKHISIGMLPNCQYFNPSVFIFYAYLLKLPYSIEELGNFPIDLEKIKKYDVLIVKYPKISAESLSFYRNIFYKEMDKLGYNTLGFDKMAEFKLPDNSKAFIYYKAHAF